MGVIIPGYHLTSAKDLPEMRYRLKGGGGKHNAAAQPLTLTSLVDMFASLIFFLIHTYGTSGQVEFINPAVEIPDTEHALMLKRAPIITVMRDKVSLEGDNSADSNDGIGEKLEETDWELPMMKAKLLEYKRFFESIHTDVKYPPAVIIQADKALEFMYIKRVLFTLTKMGFSNVTIAVRGKANMEMDPEPAPQ